MPSVIEYEHSIGEPGHQQYLELRPSERHLRGQFNAGHYRHLEVGQEKMYLALVISRLLQSFRAAPVGLKIVVIVGQYVRDALQDVGVVVNYEDRSLTVLGSSGPYSALPRGTLGAIRILKPSRDRCLAAYFRILFAK